ncbi:MAG: preprotein translocase subunit SecE [Terriglobia bacterium]
MALGTAAKTMAEEIGIPKNFLQRLRDYFTEVRGEMKRVTWPGKQEIYGTTLMVILTTFLFGFYFWITDHAFSALVGRVLKYFLGR